MEEPPRDGSQGSGGSHRPEPPPEARLARLDRLAREAWRAGDLARAERLFRVLVAEGGRTRWAELALGDLFVLADQRGASRSRRRGYFRRYLARFPRGRFAAEARAGLCRLETGEAAARCWRDYLAHHPAGAHAAEAKRALRGGRSP